MVEYSKLTTEDLISFAKDIFKKQKSGYIYLPPEILDNFSKEEIETFLKEQYDKPSFY